VTVLRGLAGGVGVAAGVVAAEGGVAPESMKRGFTCALTGSATGVGWTLEGGCVAGVLKDNGVLGVFRGACEGLDSAS